MKESNNDSGLAAKRSNRRFIVGLTAIAVSLALQAQDFSRLGERSIIGTARYVGMGGAMSAIGGDPSAAHDNPAGLGLYRRAEVLFTLDVTLDRTLQQGYTYMGYKNRMNVPQASVVISFPSYILSDEGVQFNNLLFSYRRLQSYYRDIYAASNQPAASLGNMLSYADVNWDIPFCTDPQSASNTLLIQESGAVNEFAIDWAINISNRCFVGAGIQVQSSSLSDDAVYTETFHAINTDGKQFYNRNKTSLLLSSTTATASLGLIYRPLGWLRLGLAMQTSSFGALKAYTTGELSALTDSLRYSYAPDLSYRDDAFHMPWHVSSSVAFQIGAYGLAAIQYDYRHQKDELDTHSLRAGFEVIPILGMYINAGYAYESTFKNDTRVVGIDPTFDRQDAYFQHPIGTHFASLAIGYRGTHMLVQAAYQYAYQSLNLWAHELADPYRINAQTHRIVLTLGWHQN